MSMPSVMKGKLPTEIRPWIVPLPSHNPVSDIKVKCPVCDEQMLSFLVDPSCKGHEVMTLGAKFRMCPKCQSNFIFSDEAIEIVWRRAHK